MAMTAMLLASATNVVPHGDMRDLRLTVCIKCCMDFLHKTRRRGKETSRELGHANSVKSRIRIVARAPVSAPNGIGLPATTAFPNTQRHLHSHTWKQR